MSVFVRDRNIFVLSLPCFFFQFSYFRIFSAQFLLSCLSQYQICPLQIFILSQSFHHVVSVLSQEIILLNGLFPFTAFYAQFISLFRIFSSSNYCPRHIIFPPVHPLFRVSFQSILHLTHRFPNNSICMLYDYQFKQIHPVINESITRCNYSDSPLRHFLLIIRLFLALIHYESIFLRWK